MAEGFDIIYLAWNRLEFTKATFLTMLENTSWEDVHRLLVYDDGSEDGTTEWLAEAVNESPVEARFYDHLRKRSPVAVMNHYLDHTSSVMFAKIDNDIMLPPGWLGTMLDVMERNPDLQLLGMEAGRTPDAEFSDVPYVTGASHIGGVGLMRTWAFRCRPRPQPAGRFGFTEWQHHYRPELGWVTPDLPVSSLDRIPFDPWAGYSDYYVRKGWQRNWPRYDENGDASYWSWWPDWMERP